MRKNGRHHNNKKPLGTGSVQASLRATGACRLGCPSPLEAGALLFHVAISITPLSIRWAIMRARRLPTAPRGERHEAATLRSSVSQPRSKPNQPNQAKMPPCALLIKRKPLVVVGMGHPNNCVHPYRSVFRACCVQQTRAVSERPAALEGARANHSPRGQRVGIGRGIRRAGCAVTVTTPAAGTKSEWGRLLWAFISNYSYLSYHPLDAGQLPWQPLSLAMCILHSFFCFTVAKH